MREVSTKILLGFLVAGLVIPTVLLVRPKKAEALLSLAACFAAKGVAAAQATASAAPGAVLSVSTSDIANTVQSGTSPAGTDWRSCFLGSLAKIIAKTLLHTFTQSIVNWINTGFEGSPSFVTNPEGFLNDVADQTIGRVIEDISPLLCAPFKLDIRFALGLNLSLNSRDEVHCRLSDVISNVRGAYDSFVGGTIGSGNLSNWIHIAGTQSNNPYGAYIATTDIMSARIVSATGQQIKLLDWGNGFKSWRSCEKWGPDVKAADGKTIRKGACIKEGPIKTPGSIIQDQTTGALGSTLRELELASEIDEVVGALINQLLVKAMTGVGGLLGASKGDSSNGGVSAIEALMTDPNAAIANADTQAPTGINCRLRYYPATIEKGSGIYVPDEAKTQVWTDNLGVNKTIGVKDGDNRPLVEAKYVKRTNGEIITDIKYLTTTEAATDGLQTFVTREPGTTWADYFNNVRTGCSNEWNTLITNASTGALATTPGAGGATPGTPPPPVTPPKVATNMNRDIPLSTAALNQSHIYTHEGIEYGPNVAANGVYSYSSTAYGPAPHWWSASLNQDEEISVIKVRAHENAGYKIDSIKLALLPPEKIGVPVKLSDFTSDTTDTEGKTVKGTIVYSAEEAYSSTFQTTYPAGGYENAKITGDQKERIITFTKPVKANALVIYNPSCGSNQACFALRSVKLYRAPVTDTPNTPPEPPQFAMTASPSTTSLASPDVGVRFVPWNPSFLPNKSESGIRFRAKFFTCVNATPTPNVPCEYKPDPEFFGNYFSSLNINYTNGNITREKNAITVQSGLGFTYNTDGANPQGGSGDIIIVEGNGPTFLFAKDLSVVENNPVSVSVTGTLRQKIRFRIVIEAEKVETNGSLTSLGKATADFVMP